MDRRRAQTTAGSSPFAFHGTLCGRAECSWLSAPDPAEHDAGVRIPKQDGAVLAHSEVMLASFTTLRHRSTSERDMAVSSSGVDQTGVMPSLANS